MTTLITPATASVSAPPEPPILYGYRDVVTKLPDGSCDWVRVPLTLEDCLHPEEGDVIMESSLHDLILDYLAGVFRWKTSNDASALVLHNTGIYWDKPHLKHHAPDIAVIFGIRVRKVNYKRFVVAEEKTRPRLILEAVSPNVRDNDVNKKVVQYHEAEVPLYVILDKEKEEDPWRLRGYQWAPTHYLEMPKDELGRLWLEPVGVWLEVDGQEVRCRDGVTGELIGDYTEVRQQLAKQAVQLQVERARADAEAQARLTEEKARLAAEARLRELEAELKRLREQSSPPTP